ncbi:hypothetical protein VQH23_16245 [Pararoseomonas sp. SCSIO 73927]|uniref:hypothetical protein n=1 Tax=Pararoseomonas sp. SCSIO 73927 TaxID=3114537 RepID=UPI0030D3365F
MDPFTQAAVDLAAGDLGVDAEYRAQGTGKPIPCRILLFTEPDDTSRPGLSAGAMVASGHLHPTLGMVAVARKDTFAVAGRGLLTVDQLKKPARGWDWRVYLQEAG